MEKWADYYLDINPDSVAKRWQSFTKDHFSNKLPYLMHSVSKILEYFSNNSLMFTMAALTRNTLQLEYCEIFLLFKTSLVFNSEW